ncbi:FUSC family protein [Nakamurella flavida]|uniref:FUSC family protein n=1 Tax=Nakamurella flavida TaxID=363630 RepID=A0A938YCX5_9ACTN|nr:FUSC family protein [Nakamurella flavida]MBM9475356.1 FUSC family protein [Nakamurella flavida]MDP9776934.1 putative membrane protein YccC [Nakamurella flavida]
MSTVVLAVTDLLIGRPQIVSFGVFGTFALLLFAEFPGTRQARAAAFGLLAVLGAVLIALGTLVSTSWWLASALMAVVGFLVVFAGFLSAATAGGTRAALLTFILPATVPAPPADIPDRLIGWAIALALAVPAALFLWPPADHDRMRLLSAASCRALAGRLHGMLDDAPHPAGAAPGDGDPDPVRVADDDLRRVMRASAARPVGMTTGSRLLLRLVDEVDWLATLTGRASAATVRAWPSWTREIVAGCADVLTAAAKLLPAAERSRAHRDRLDACLTALSAARDRATDRLADSLAGSGLRAGLLRAEHRAQLVHEWAYACDLLGRTVRDAADADARPVWQRLIGRSTTTLAVGTGDAIRLLTVRQARLGSVAVQNGLRTGAGLGVAVLIAQVSHVQHGFWIALGAMSVLRTSAVSTTATVGRALLGTVVGFVVGWALLALVGTGPGTLWVLLPLAVLIAGFAPATGSVAAGQAAFTVVVLVLFTLLQPVGWTLGLVRVEDVALGCGAALLVGVLLWPRGAADSVREALADAYRASTDTLTGAVTAALRGRSAHTAVPAAAPASVRLEGALRQYLAERTRPIGVAELSLAANGVGRLRLAAEALAGLPDASMPVHPRAGAAHRVEDEIRVRAQESAVWFRAWADALTRPTGALPPPPPADLEHRVVATLLADPPGADRPTGIQLALRVTWVGLYLDDAALLAHTLAGLSLTTPTAAGPTHRP